MLVREKREKVSKILIITNHSYMFYRFRLELIQELMKDHEVVLSMPFVGHEQDFMDMGLRCINTELDRRSINPKKDIKLFSFYWKLLKEEKPDMVIPDMDEPCLGTPAQRNIDKRITEESNTELSSIYSIPSDSSRPSVLAALDTKRKEAEYKDMKLYRELIMDNIEYEILQENNPYDREMLEEILELLVDTVCATKKYIRVAGSDYPAEVVRSRLLKLNAHHIEFVISCFKENTTKVRNVKQYLLTSLYNAPVTIDSYYTALVQHDLYGTPRE